MTLYVNDDVVDLFPDAQIFYTVQRVNIGNLTNRSVNTTTSFKAPWTENNERIFGFARHEESPDPIIYTLRPCRISNKGVDITRNNVLYITQSEDRSFSLQVFENIFEYFMSVNDKNLADMEPIDSSAWNPSDIDAARLNTEGIFSALINWGILIYDSARFMPSFYYHTFIKSILEFTGLTIEGDILTDARFTDLVVPYARDKFEYPESYYTQFNFYNPRMADQAVGPIINNETVVFGDNVTEDKHGTFFARVSVGGITWGTGTNLWLRLRKNGTLVMSGVIATNPAPGGSLEMQYNDYADNGDVFNFYIYADAPGAMGTSYTIVAGAGASSYMLFTADGIVNRELVNWNQLLPEVKCTDLLKEFFNRFGVIPNQVDNRLILKTLEEIIADTAGAVDWSDKLVNVKNKKISFKSEYAQSNFFSYVDLVKDPSLGRGSIDVNNTTLALQRTLYQSIFGNTNNIQYLSWFLASIPVYDPNEEISREFEDGRTVTGADSIVQTDEGTAVILASGSPFNFTLDALTTDTRVMLRNDGSATVTLIEGTATISSTTVGIPSGFHVIIDYRTSTTPDIYLYETIEEGEFSESPGLRLLTLKDVDLENSITFDATPRSDYKIGYFVDSALAKDTGFQYFVDQFYPSLTEALQRNKVITKEYLLTEHDIFSYDPHRMMWDGQGYYIINKIGNFYPERITKVELFKVL